MKKSKIISLILIFLVVAAGAFFGVQFFTSTGIFKKPGVITYSESLTDEEIAFLKEIFAEDVVLDKDVTISAETSLTAQTGDNLLLYEIYVPVMDFYTAKSDLSASEVTDDILIPVSELNSKVKLMSIDGEYYLDTFSSGAHFRYLIFEGENISESMDLVSPQLAQTYPTKDTVLTFAQTGVTALSRDMITKLNSTGGDGAYFAANIKDFLSSFDLTHTSNESSFIASAYAPGTVSSRTTICSDERMIDTLTAIGLDIVELTGNHNRDCGDDPANETIDTYNELGIKIVGGGKTAAEAAEPLQISEKGTNITMLAYNQSTGGATYDDTPGANQYYEEDAASNIAAAKARGDFVIVDVQYYECNLYGNVTEDTYCDYADSAAGDQIGFFRHLIDLGADIVVGTSAHQTQTYERYNGGVIYYGLGNLFFDQVWWPGTTRSLVLGHYFYNGTLLQTRLYGTIYGDEMQPELLDEETLTWFIDRLNQARP